MLIGSLATGLVYLLATLFVLSSFVIYRVVSRDDELTGSRFDGDDRDNDDVGEH